MLDGLFGRGFSSKCKSLIKPTRTRIDVLRKRKEATQRFLKGNLAQFLSNGLDINAFGRTEEFLAGLNVLSCYDFIEQSCEYILKKLSAMQKQRECPEECREAVGSLMFAAARFSDLPELRDLRDALQERYGCSLEHFVNQEFVERLALKPPTIEKKIQLLHDITLEFSIKWDSGGFQQRMANPSVLAQNKPKKAEPIHVHGSTHNIRTDNGTANTYKQDNLFKEKGELTSDRHRANSDGENYVMRRDEWGHQPYGGDESTGKSPKPRMGSEQCTPKWDNYDVTPRGRRELNNDKNESTPRKVKEETVRRRDRHRSSSRKKRPEVVDHTYEVQKNRMNGFSKREGYGSVSDEKCAEVPSNQDGKNISSAGYMDDNQPNTAKLLKINQVEGVDSLKSHSSYGLPPPYVKPKDKLVPPPYIKSRDAKERINKEAKGLSSACDGASVGHSKHERENGEGREERILGESDHSNFEDQGTGQEKNVSYRDNIPLPRPRSIRRKHSKSSSNRDDLGNSEDSEVVKRSSSSRRRDHHSKKGLQILFDDEHKQRDEEERIIDKLLLHYSKKPSTYDQEKVRRKAKSHACETPHDGSYEGETLPHPTRSVSLPREQIASKQQVKVYARANSFQPEKPATHVHPKLPDYDDLAAQFAALKGH